MKKEKGFNLSTLVVFKYYNNHLSEIKNRPKVFSWAACK